MGKTRARAKEEGVALLLAVFALLLISAVGLAMLYSADTETWISANYRDKQVAIYGAMSGLQEARARIHPLNGDLTKAGVVPTGLPTLDTKNVLYIINPAKNPDGSYEDVRPWDPSNKYFDPELCQENVLDMTGTPGVPCSASSLPSGVWYQVADNSTISSEWQRTTPLAYKWVRVTLKASDMTPVKVGNVDGQQVCWNPGNEIVLPGGYGTDCHPIGGLKEIDVTAQGSGYTSAPTVQITGGGGSGAAATANLTMTPSDSLGTVEITSRGSGYTSAPTITIGGTGTGAQAKATIVAPGAPVASVSFTDGTPSGCYTNGLPPTVTVTNASGDTTGSGAKVSAVGKMGCVATFTPSGSCPGGTTTPFQVTTGDGGGSGFEGTITLKGGNGSKAGNMTGSSLDSPGGNYTSQPTVLGTLPSGCNISAAFSLGWQLTGLSLDQGGSGYTKPPIVTIVPPTIPAQTTKPSGTTTLGPNATNAGEIDTITLTSGGSGYTTDVPLVFTGGGGTGAAAIAHLGSTGKVTSITLNSPGSHYTREPKVTISGGGGSGATAVAKLSNNTYYGQVYVLTALAETQNGSRALVQMEAGTLMADYTFSLGGALTIVGPSANFGSPNSNVFGISGIDANSCGETAMPPRPAIGVWDDPNNPTNPTSVESVLSKLGKPDNYVGAQGAPDVENVFGMLGSAGGTPAGMEAFAASTVSQAKNTYTGPVDDSMINLGGPDPDQWAVDVVNGDLTISGNPTGYGILLVTGKLTMTGNFTWKGVVLVIGEGVFDNSGGGNGSIDGAMFVANTTDAGKTRINFGSSTANWNGGGGNGIHYDHCWADNLLNSIPFIPSASPNSLQVISMRVLSF